MQQHIVATKKRPGYSGTTNTLKPLSYLVSGQLATGMKLNPHLLEDFGISRSESYEVRISWRQLKWVDQGDCITERCEQLAHASGDEYQDLLVKDLKEAYLDIFEQLADPAHATHQELKDAFQKSGYEPISMQSKMIALFRGLCREAGLITDEVDVPEVLIEQRLEDSSSSLQETPELEIHDLVEGNALMVEPPSLPHLNGSAPISGDATVEELGEFLTYLHQLPKKSWWTETEEHRAWLREGIVFCAEQIVQATKGRGGRK